MLGAEVSSLGLQEKYQILVAYQRGGGVAGVAKILQDDEDTHHEEDESIIEHEGKKYRQVQIEDENQEYLMDEEGKIYNLNFEYIGHANDDSEGGEGGLGA